MSRAEKAKELFKQGYACSQAVALAFVDLVGVSREDITKLTLPFGGGLGRLRLTCGAISGMAVVIGLLFAEDKATQENKKEVYAITQVLCEKFKAENGSLICADLLAGANLQVSVGGVAEKRTDEYYKKRPCADIVYSAARILEEYLQEKGIIA
ncbi:MAG: C_GCAxxG_C_C family protein [Clostridia bacterium]|nr:C_GCAxxG_C_C family protein [Clostridia bacterium]